MSTKPRLTNLNKRLSEKLKNVNTEAALEANPAHGEKGDFVKVTVTMPPKVYAMIMGEATRRKMTKERNPNLSAIIREAAVAYLDEK